MQNSNRSDLQYLPSVDKLLQASALSSTLIRFGHDCVLLEARLVLDKWRSNLIADSGSVGPQVREAGFLAKLCADIASAVQARNQATLVPVFNLSGTVNHTNLGRASLPASAIAAMVRVAEGPVNLEYDLVSGKRGDRDSHLEKILCEITGAEAATIVNNNAAAVVLVLTSLAVGRDVLISRGELVEIGGSFRIPEVMGSAGCRLKEVGTTNRTHLQDYAKAINETTALIMKVHTSNYEIKGFTKVVELDELSVLAKSSNLPLVADLGSGTLVDLEQYGLPKEPTVQAALLNGADIVTFSGDKLLGGPQAGIIVGSRELIARLKKNPLKRALRVDKITIAALLEVLMLYRDPRRLAENLPLLQDLSRPIQEIQEVAEMVLPLVSEQLKQWADVCIEPCKSQIGSGALPLQQLGSVALVIRPRMEMVAKDRLLQQIANSFRQLPQPVIGRLRDGSLVFDLRCLRNPTEFCAQLTQVVVSTSIS